LQLFSADVLDAIGALAIPMTLAKPVNFRVFLLELGGI